MRRVLFAVLMLCTGTLAIPAGAQRTDATPAPLAAWVGCWEPVDAVLMDGFVCVTPGDEVGALRIVEIISGTVASTTELVVDGTQRAFESEGCMGWQRARLTRDGARIAIDAEVTCGSAPAQRRSGAYLITPAGEWVQVQGGGFTAVTTAQARRWRALTSLARVPSEVREALAAHLVSAEQARLRLSASPVSASDLVELEALGVAPPVIDFVVAAAYPKTFALDATGLVVAAVADAAGGERMERRITSMPSFFGFGYPSLLYTDWMMQSSCGLVAWGIADPFACGGMSRYGTSWNRTNQYYGGLWPGYYPVGTTIVVLPGGSGGGSGSGKVVNGRGYSQRGSGGSGMARPRTETAGARQGSGASSRGSGSSSSSGSGASAGSSQGSGSSGSAGGSASSGSSGGSSTRTAQPRKP